LTVPCDTLEASVLRDLFKLFGNPAAVLRAVEEATPNGDKLQESRERQAQLRADLAGVKAARERVVRAISRGTLNDDQADTELRALKGREDALAGQLTALEAALADAPDPEEVRRSAAQIAERFNRAKAEANLNPEAMSWEEQRTLVELVFAGRSAGAGYLTPQGERRGIYVKRTGRKGSWHQEWAYRISGRVAVEFWGTTTPGLEGWESVPDALQGARQGELLEGQGISGNTFDPSGPVRR
jgi:hypothetical protein